MLGKELPKVLIQHRIFVRQGKANCFFLFNLGIGFPLKCYYISSTLDFLLKEIVVELATK